VARPRHLRRTHKVIGGAVLAALILAGAALTLWPGGGAPASTASVTTQTTSPTAQPPDRDAARPSRGGQPRASRPQARPAPEAEPAPEATEPDGADPGAPDAVPDGGEVVTSGTCGASYYWEPQPTASGEAFDPEAMTAAHLTWDFDTRVRVTNPANGRSVVVRINDRGPYVDGRCLDLARGAFREIADLDQGVVTVTYEVLSD
jgi:rare lipoprotein A